MTLLELARKSCHKPAGVRAEYDFVAVENTLRLVAVSVRYVRESVRVDVPSANCQSLPIGVTYVDP